MAQIDPTTGQPYGDTYNPFDPTKPIADVNLANQLQQDYQTIFGNKTPTTPTTPTVPTTPTTPTTPSDPTIGDVYSGYVPGENTELNDAESAYLKMLKEQSQPVDEDAIRRKTQEQFQAEIDAVNRLFAEKKAEEARVGQGRIGSGTAVQARRGLLGSTFGEAQKERIVSYNQSIQDAIQAEQQLQLASIMSEVRQSAKDEAAAKTLARQQGAVAYVEFLRGQADRKQQRVSDAITNVLNSDTEVSEDLFATLAKELGVSVDIIKSQYNSAKKANDKANAKEAVKGIEVNGSIIDPVTGDVIYQGTPKAESYSGVVGEYEYYKKQEENAGRTPLSFNEYQNADANRKARAEKALIGGIDPALVSLGTAYGSKFDSSPIVKQFNEVQNKKLGIDRLLSDGTVGGAQDVALVFDFMKALDPTSVVRESEYDTASKSGNLFMGSLAKFNGLFKAEGGKLPESVREEFQKIVEQKYSTVKQQYSNLYSENKRKMEALGITDPDVFLTDYTGGENPIVNTDTGDDYDFLFGKPLSMGVNGSTDVSGIKDYAKVSTAIGQGTATGIVAGSPLWKWGYDLVLEGGKGARVKSPVSGTIVKSGVDGGFGKRVGVKDAQGRVWYFGHLNDTNVKEGQQVNALADLGGQGNTGKTLGKSGIHVDITVKKPGGGYYTSQEVASLLNTKLA